MELIAINFRKKFRLISKKKYQIDSTYIYIYIYMCVCVCVCGGGGGGGHVYVVYEDTNLYNYMGMT